MEATKPAGVESVPEIRWLSDDEASEAFDAAARLWLGASGEEFLRRWDAGEYLGIEDDPENENYILVASLISFVRP